MATPSLVAHTLISKYQDHLPLYRQEKIWQRMGVDMPRNTICGWIMNAAVVCMPMRDALMGALLTSNYIQTNETLEAKLREQNIRNVLKSHLDFNFLSYTANEVNEIIPGFSLQQLFLDAAFIYPVRINVVIGDSSINDIREGNIQRKRDIALAFPGVPLPVFADGLASPRALDFMYHDFYHCVRASQVNPDETQIYVAIGDNLHKMQKICNEAVKRYRMIHEEHKQALPLFADKINHFARKKQTFFIEKARSKFNEEIKIIRLMTEIRKSLGKLKFRLYDMERMASGETFADSTDPLDQSLRILTNIELEINYFSNLNCMSDLKKPLGRLLGHILLQELKPNLAVLRRMIDTIQQDRKKMLADEIMHNPARVAFHDSIINYTY